MGDQHYPGPPDIPIQSEVEKIVMVRLKFFMLPSIEMLCRANDLVRGFEPDPDERPDDWTYEYMRTERNLIGRVVNRHSMFSNLEMEYIIVVIREHLPAGTVVDWEYFQSIEDSMVIFAMGDLASVIVILESVFESVFESFVCVKL